MRNLIAILGVCLALAGLSACGAGKPEAARDAVAIEAAYGSSIDNVTLESSATAVELRYATIPAAGTYLRLSLPDGTAAGVEQWSGNAATVQLVQAVPGGAEIGIAPTPAYSGGPVNLRLALEPAGRSASIPPVGERNVITDLTVFDLGGGQVALDWTQINVGDYNFDGEVNISDLTPLGANLGETYDRAATDAHLQTIYWVDGTADGAITISDLTPIGANYKAQVVGYNVKQNGNKIPGATPVSPTVARADGETRPGLPPMYHISAPGSVNDIWTVAPVDRDGLEGADSDGNVGPVDLRTTVTIVGVDLFDLDLSGESGPFGPGKFGTRVIDPVDDIDRKPIGVGSTNGTNSQFGELPKGETLLLDVFYAPTVDPATGGPRGTASLKGASAVTEDDIIVSSVPFKLPEGITEPTEIETLIELIENPAGGYFIEITSTFTYPGDDPTTPDLVETSYTRTEKTRVEYAAGLVAQDTDDDGNFEDEPKLSDPERDGVSDQRTVHGEIEDEYEDDNQEDIEFSIEGVLAEFNEAEGYIVLNNAIPDDGTLTFEVPTVATVPFDETVNFERRIRTDAGRTEEDMDPSELQVGDEIEIYLRTYTAEDGTVIAEWWARTIRQDIDLRDGGGGGGGGGGDDDDDEDED
jgi:hypothetical protein